MSYLNSPLLWLILGGIGVAVPVIIHLLHQRHRRRTDWAAMELLRRALVVRSGQVKLEDSRRMPTSLGVRIWAKSGSLWCGPLRAKARMWLWRVSL